MIKHLVFIALLSFNLSAFAFLEDVENLQIKQTGKDFVEISFEQVRDATNYTLLMGTESVSLPEDSYNLPPIIMGDNLEYRVSNLKPETTYFMRVFANSDNDQSENLSDEISINLLKSGQDLLPSDIEELIVLDSRNIQIAFKKSMQFDDETIDALRMFKNFDGNEHFIQLIEIIDDRNLKLFLKDDLDLNFDYDIHILPSLTDINANPLDPEKLVLKFSTTNDLVSFVDLTDLPDLKIISAIAFDKSAFEVEFSDPIKRDPDLRNRVKIFEAQDPDKQLKVVDVLFNELEPKKLLIVTTEVEEKNYTINLQDVQSEMGKIISPADSTVNVLNKPKSGVSEIVDVMELPADNTYSTSVADVSKLSGEVLIDDNSKIKLTFEKPKNNKLKEFKVLLENKDGKTFDLVDVISKDLSKVVLELGTPVTDAKNIKVVAVDEDGNESIGAITKLLIPETGPAAALATLIGSGLLGAVISRRRK